MATSTTYQPRLQKKYRDEVIPALMKKFGYTTVMQCPRLVKICLNQGVKGSVSDKKLIDDAEKEMTRVHEKIASADFITKTLAGAAGSLFPTSHDADLLRSARNAPGLRSLRPSAHRLRDRGRDD